MLAPTIEKLAGDYEGKVKVGKMNTDENQDTPGSLRISAIPTVVVFQNGQEKSTAWSASIARTSSRRRWTNSESPDPSAVDESAEAACPVVDSLLSVRDCKDLPSIPARGPREDLRFDARR